MPNAAWFVSTQWVLGALLTLSFAPPVSADLLLYNNTILTSTITSIGPGQSCGPVCVPAPHIEFDDVLVPVTLYPAGDALDITQVSVTVDAFPPSGGSLLDLWSFPSLTGGSPTLPPTLVASFTTHASGAQTVVFGNGVTPLFTVQPNLTAVPGYGLFYLGLESSTPGDSWEWANGPSYNLPTAYDFDVLSNQIFLNTSPGTPFPPNVSYSLEVQGEFVPPVPEPGSLLLLVTAVVLTLRFLPGLRYEGNGGITNKAPIRN
jgi:hypothetical protein